MNQLPRHMLLVCVFLFALAGLATADSPAETELEHAPASSPEMLVERSVKGWAAAWSEKNVRDYVAAYVPGFKLEGMSHDTWKKLRSDRISKPKTIEVTLSDINLSVQDDSHATVSFTQDYRADGYYDQTEKTLQMVKQSDRWLIAKESAGKAVKINAEARAAEQGNANAQHPAPVAQPLNISDHTAIPPEPAYTTQSSNTGGNTATVSEPVAQIQKTGEHTATPPEPIHVNQSSDAGGNTALVRIDRFDVKGNTLLDPRVVERLLAPFRGEGRSYTDIQRALETLEGAYRTAGYSAVNVITPEQEIAAGVVIFQVIESRIGKVILNGNEHYDKTNIRNALPALNEGFTPSARELSENIRLANENPTRQIDVVLAMGEEENTVDANVNVQDSSPHKSFVTMDNTGNQSTGMYRVGVGYQHNNLFNRDHALTLNYITSPNHVKDVTQLSASYRLPIYAVGDSVDLITAYSDSNAGTTSVGGPGGPLLTFSGKGRVYGAHYNHHLPRQGEYTSKVVAGFDYRATINNCLLAGAACSGVADVTVHPVTVTYAGTLTRPAYVADFAAAIVRNIPGGPHGGDADFSASRASATTLGAGAKADYTILHLNGSLAGALPRNWQYRVAGNSQYTNDALVSGESFGLVGANAVRGYPEGELRSEKGYFINAEIYTPDLAPELNMKDGSLRLLGFVDRASGWNISIGGDPVTRTSVGSVGVGFRYTHGKNISAKLDWARVDGNSGNTKTGDSRSQINLMATW